MVLFVTFMAISIDLKHTKANFSPSSIDSLCLQVTRPPDLAIFVWTMIDDNDNDDRHNPLSYLLLHMHTWDNYERIQCLDGAWDLKINIIM